MSSGWLRCCLLRGENMTQKTLVYMPTLEEKEKINECCVKILDCLNGLTFEQKVLALKVVTSTFANHYKIQGIRIGEV